MLLMDKSESVDIPTDDDDDWLSLNWRLCWLDIALFFWILVVVMSLSVANSFEYRFLWCPTCFFFVWLMSPVSTCFIFKFQWSAIFLMEFENFIRGMYSYIFILAAGERLLFFGFAED